MTMCEERYTREECCQGEHSDGTNVRPRRYTVEGDQPVCPDTATRSQTPVIGSNGGVPPPSPRGPVLRGSPAVRQLTSMRSVWQCMRSQGFELPTYACLHVFELSILYFECGGS